MQIALFYFFLLTTIFLQSITAVEINNPWNVYLKGGVFLWQINTTAPSYALLIENNNIQSSEVLPSPKWRSGIKM